MADDVERLILEMSADLKRFEKGLDRATATGEKRLSGLERRFEKSGQRMAASMGRGALNINQAIAGIAVGAAIREVGQYADAWTSAGNQLAAAGVPLDQLAGRQRELVTLANETRTALAPTVDLYARLTRSTEEIGASSAQVARVTEITNKAFKAGGAAAQEQAAGILQLGQALGSGVLQGDELRSLRENAPLIAQAIADEFGTTIGGLKKLGAEGKLTSDRVFEAILRGGQAIDAQFAVTTPTISDSFNVLRNEATLFIGELDKATGASKALGEFIVYVSENLDTLAAAATIAAAVVGGVLAGQAVVALIAAAGRAGLALGITNTAIAATGVRAVASAAGVRILTGALAFFGGPIGLAVTAVAIAVGLFAANAGRAALESQAMASALEEQARAAGLAKEETERLGGEVTATEKWTAGLTDETNLLADAHYRAAAAAKAQAIEEARLRLVTANNTLRDNIETFNQARARARTQGGNTVAAGARSGVNASGQLLGNEIANRENAVVNTQVGRNLIESTRIVKAETENLRGLLSESLTSERFSPPRFNRPAVEGGGGGRGSGADARAKAEAAEREATQQRLALKSIEARNKLELATLEDNLDRIRALEREEMLRSRISDYQENGLNLETATSKAKADQAAYDAARATQIERGLRDRQSSLELEIAETDQNLEQVRAIERRLDLQESTRALQELGLSLADAETKALEDQVRLEDARARAKARYLEEAEASRQQQLAADRGDSAEAARQARAIELRNRSRTYQEQGGLSAPDADARARREILEETRVSAQGAFRDAFRNGVLEAVRSGDVIGAIGEFALNAADQMTEKVLNQAGDALFELLSNQFPNLFDLGSELAGDATGAATTAAAITTATATGAATLATAVTTSTAAGAPVLAAGVTTGAATAGAIMAAAITTAGAQAAAAMAAAIASGQSGGNAASAIASAFVGGRATGGPVRYHMRNERGPEPFVPTSNGIVFSNQAMRGLASLGKLASQGGGMGGDVNLEVVNMTGVPAKASTEKKPDGGMKLTLEPMFEKGIEGAGRSGALARAARKSPSPTKRG